MAPPLEPHLAWPLSAAEIRAAVGDEAPGVRIARPVRRRALDAVVRVTWVPEPDRLDLDGDPLLVVVSPIPVEGRAALRAVLRDEVLPDLGAWVRAALSADPQWKALRHVRRYVVHGHRVEIDERDGRGLVAASDPR